MIWRENTDVRGWAEWRDLTASGYSEKGKSMRDKGYRPLDVEAYDTPSGLRFAGIWIENTEKLGWSTRRGLTLEALSSYAKAQRDKGQRMVDFEAYAPRRIRYAAIWLQNQPNLLAHPKRNSRGINDTWTTSTPRLPYDGLRVLADVVGQRYAAIWVKDASGRASAVRTDLSALQFANLWREYLDKGLRIIDFERYDTKSGARYGGIWVENATARYRWAKKGAVDSIVTEYRRDDNTPPGLSVAIIKDGTMVYRRGVGFADRKAGKVAHGGTVYLTGSTSKAIGGTLAVKLENERRLADGTGIRLSLDSQTQTLLRGVDLDSKSYMMPSHHTHSVTQLMAHLGCVHHYDTGSELVPPIRQYTTAGAATLRLWNAPLLTGCTIGQSVNYSTPAWTYVATVLEEMTGRSINRLVREEIAERYGLGIRVMYETSTLPPNYERSVPYSNDGAKATTYENNSWKVLGGGMEVSAVELARFGWKVLNGDIVAPRARDERLWKRVRSNSQYGLGWKVFRDNSRRVAEHGGIATGARSKLWIYRDDGLVIAIMTNSRSQPAEDVDGLAKQIGAAVLN